MYIMINVLKYFYLEGNKKFNMINLVVENYDILVVGIDV